MSIQTSEQRPQHGLSNDGGTIIAKLFLNQEPGNTVTCPQRLRSEPLPELDWPEDLYADGLGN